MLIGNCCVRDSFVRFLIESMYNSYLVLFILKINIYHCKHIEYQFLRVISITSLFVSLITYVSDNGNLMKIRLSAKLRKLLTEKTNKYTN